MEVDMTGTSWVRAVHNLPDHPWLPFLRSQSSTLRISGNVPNPFLSEPCSFGLWFPEKRIFLLKRALKANWVLDCPEKSDPQNLG